MLFLSLAHFGWFAQNASMISLAARGPNFISLPTSFLHPTNQRAYQICSAVGNTDPGSYDTQHFHQRIVVPLLIIAGWWVAE
jgi:hypothetical protein